MPYALLAGRAGIDITGGDEDIAQAAGPQALRLSLTGGEVQTLERVARHYEAVLGPLRYMIVLFLPARTRRKYRYIRQESSRLEAVIASLPRPGDSTTAIQLSLDDGVALWGRLLSCLNTKRSRRRLSPGDLATTEALESKIADSIGEMAGHRDSTVRAAIHTRRLREVGWMLAQLGPDPEPLQRQHVNEPERNA